jgi:hypothetical protein
MCEWGKTRDLLVSIPAHLSHTGKRRWAWKPVDSCIADIVEALNVFGIYTESSCCGHGKENGSIILQDGRVLIIKAPPNNSLNPT